MEYLDDMDETDLLELYDKYARGEIPRYKDHLDDENYAEELEKVPLFMTRSPDKIDAEGSTALAALASIIHEESTPEEKIEYFKEQGNAHFKKRGDQNMKKAVELYTEGIQIETTNTTLRATMLLNRAAANLLLENNRSALIDCTLAKKLDPSNVKAYFRAAKACLAIGQYALGLKWCDEGLAVESSNTAIQEERAKILKARAEAEKKQRIELKRQKAEQEKDAKVHAAIAERGIRIANHPNVEQEYDDNDDDDEEGKRKPRKIKLENPSNAVVHLDKDGFLVWPVFFLYPEFGQSELIIEFHEECTFHEQLEIMFSPENPPSWDHDRMYTPENIEIFFEANDEQSQAAAKPRLVRVGTDKTLRQALAHSKYTVVGGTPTFVVLSKKSPFNVGTYLKRGRN